jgi:hypothetical protein
VQDFVVNPSRRHSSSRRIEGSSLLCISF